MSRAEQSRWEVRASYFETSREPSDDPDAQQRAAVAARAMIPPGVTLVTPAMLVGPLGTRAYGLQLVVEAETPGEACNRAAELTLAVWERAGVHLGELREIVVVSPDRDPRSW